MSRYKELQQSELDEAQRRVWNDVVVGPRGSMPPPAHVWLKSPGLADHAHKLGAHVRFGTDLSSKLTEIAIPVTADIGRRSSNGMRMPGWLSKPAWPQEVIEAIAARRPPVFSNPNEQLVYDFCHLLSQPRCRWGGIRKGKAAFWRARAGRPHRAYRLLLVCVGDAQRVRSTGSPGAALLPK
jgi:4-carboxymuconolactone decarboxylase